jgi:undecaprenyl-diphosphatase
MSADVNRVHLRLGRPLLAGSARFWAGGVLACCAIIVAVLGVMFANKTTPDWFDRAVDAPIISWLGGHGELAFRLASPGTLIPAVALTAIIAACCVLAGRLNGAVLAVSGVPVAEGLVERVLKPAFQRTDLGKLSYPSGHTTAVFAIAATVAVLLLLPPRRQRARWLQVLAAATAFLISCVVVVAVIALQWHYFTDTVGGAAVAIGTVCALALVLDLPVLRRLGSRLTGETRAAAQLSALATPTGQDTPVPPRPQ